MSDVSELVKRLRAFNNLTDEGHDTRIVAADALTAQQAEIERLREVIRIMADRAAAADKDGQA